MKYLSIEEILFMHHRILIELQPLNDDFTILNPGMLESAVARPKQAVFDRELYPDPYSKAAALTESLISNHVFRDGNKRVGISAGIVFLVNNGVEVNADDDDVYEVAIKTSDGSWKYEEIKEWFEKHSC